MTIQGLDVNRDSPKTYLTLSAVGDLDPQPDRSPAPPPEAVVRDERDPMTPDLLDELLGWPESEKRFAWGDR